MVTFASSAPGNVLPGRLSHFMPDRYNTIYYSDPPVIHMPQNAQMAIAKVYQHLCICGDLSMESTQIFIGLTSYLIANTKTRKSLR